MKYVAFDSFKHLDYVRAVLTVPISNVTGGVVALDDLGVPVAVCLADGWTHNSCTVHHAIQKPMALRGLFREFANYVFHFGDKKMMIGIVESNHKEALRLNKHIGFKEIYRIENCYADGVDQIIMQLMKEDCRFLSKKYRLEEAA